VSGGSDVAKTVTDEEILSLVDSGQLEGVIESEEKEMIRSVLEFGETLVREVMVPRLDVTALDLESPLPKAIHEFVDSGHSRIPVYEEKIDNIKGVLYAKDLLHVVDTGELSQRSIRDLMRPAYFVPETKRAETLFKEMQARKVHLAIVVDEYGGTAGLVTIEDLVEEIVGDIQDEYDQNEEAEYVQIGENDYTFDGSINLDDFNSLMKSDLSSEDNDTLGGYIYGVLGRVPDAGETLEVDDGDGKLVMHIDSVDGRRIRKVHVTRIQPQPDEPEPNGAKPAAKSADEVQEEVSPRASNA
jgi:putative hemolysin